MEIWKSKRWPQTTQESIIDPADDSQDPEDDAAPAELENLEISLRVQAVDHQEHAGEAKSQQDESVYNLQIILKPMLEDCKIQTGCRRPRNVVTAEVKIQSLLNILLPFSFLSFLGKISSGNLEYFVSVNLSRWWKSLKR